MCTLSWVRTSSAQYSAFFNRDEQRSRVPGHPPRRGTTGRTPWIAPIDGEAGGTWIGVNGHGVTLALLNRYADTPHEVPGSPVSRGLLVRDLLDTSDPDNLAHRLAAAPLRDYLPFTLVVLAPGHPADVHEWDGGRLVTSTVAENGLLRTSSGVDQAGAERVRGNLFTAHPPATDVLANLHRSHDPEPGALSVCMHRSDAMTVSFAHVDVTAERMTMRYAPGPPCITPVTEELTLARLPTAR